MLLRLALVMTAFALSACASGRGPGGGQAISGISCAPFARELSGIALYGDAYTWWQQADGSYVRSNRPVLGAALVFMREPRLPTGHVSVVSRMLGTRQIQVTQANWAPGEVDVDQLVVDVSARNDWSEVKVWWPPIGALGSHGYPTFGFIEPGAPSTREEIVRTTPTAARLAVGSARGRPVPRARQMAAGNS